ncbi:NAD(P)-dependent oxidoreductase [Streptosporangium lutulentum]
MSLEPPRRRASGGSSGPDGSGHGTAARAGRVDVAVWNRTRSKAEELVADGASVAESIGDLADRDVVFTMVSSSEDLEQVLVGEGGLLTAGGPVPPIVVDCSTVSAETSAEMRAAVNRHGAEFLASPVSGNGKVVASGKLSFVVSGPEEVYDKVAPLLGAIGRSASYVGEGRRPGW